MPAPCFVRFVFPLSLVLLLCVLPFPSLCLLVCAVGPACPGGGGGLAVAVGSEPRELYALPMLDLIKSIKDLGLEAPRPSGGL